MRGLVVPAAGRGSRFGSAENKIWATVEGRSLIEWTLLAFDAHPCIDEIVVAGSRADLARLRRLAARYPKTGAVVEGGACRAESVRNGLLALSSACSTVLVHDAARPAVSAAVVSRVVEATEQFGAAVPGIALSDTIKRVGPDGAVVATISRDGLWAVQTPQGARTADLLAAYAKLGVDGGGATDEAGLLEAAGYAVHVVEGEETNLKVTHPADLERASRILRGDGAGVVRTGFGYDVHPFAEGRPLWLGGVEIPHARGLAGHSDADAVLHALCDALLGAAGLGDIGMVFPDSDAAHKDRPSLEFVGVVAGMLRQAGWTIANVDVALLAEEPKIGPYRERMTAAIAGGLQLASTQVNVKATTAERMGFVGRREGIACWAVATIVR